MIERHKPDAECTHIAVRFHSITIFSRILCYCPKCDSYLWASDVETSKFNLKDLWV